MTTLTIRADFSKRVHEAHKKPAVLEKTIIGIQISGFEWPRDERQVRLRLGEYKPGHGWMLTGYMVTNINKD